MYIHIFLVVAKTLAKNERKPLHFSSYRPIGKFLCGPFQLGVVYLREFLLKYSCISLKIPCYDFSNDESDFLKWVLVIETTLLKS